MKNKTVSMVLVLVILIVIVGALYLVGKNHMPATDTTVIPNGQTQTANNANGTDYQPNPGNVDMNQHEDSEITGDTGNLVSLSITGGALLSGNVTITGSVKGGYFFEGSFPVTITDMNGVTLKTLPAHSTSSWTTSGPVSFSIIFDASAMHGPAFIILTQDDPSGGANGAPKSIKIPVLFQ